MASPFPPSLAPSVLSLNFGAVIKGGVQAILTMTATNISTDTGIEIFNIVTDNPDFVVTSTIPTVVNPQQTITIQVTFTSPAGTGTQTGNLTVNSDAANDPLITGMTASVVNGGALSISPSSWIFNQTQVGFNSGTETFTVTNTGDVNVIVQIPVIASPFTGSGLPGSATTLTPTQSMTFGVFFSPVQQGYVVNAQGISITANDPVANHYVDLEGMGILITPAYVVTGGTEFVYVAFQNLLYKFDPTNLVPESTAQAIRTMSLAGPGFEGQILRVELDYEDWGPALVQVTAANEYGRISSQAVSIGSPAAYQNDKHAVADLKITGAFITLTIAPIEGPLVLTAYIARWADGGEIKK